jgi:spermidine/putrescine transport system ATP-binding protein
MTTAPENTSTMLHDDASPSPRHPHTASANTPSGGGRVDLADLEKYYGTQRVLNGINLTIESGEFFSLLGPSGCGKTTTLRLIGGFEPIELGSVHIDGVDMRDIPAERRPVNTVFQSYALFPHKSVADNVGFGLRFQNCTKAEAKRRVAEALALVQLEEYADRRPHQLSGGQQQRVALARSLVLRPKVLLLDEPLGALDAKLRRTLQLELRSLHKEVGITFVYVTHDQEEALTMSDRLAVMRSGDIVQVGTPQQVYDAPETTYVADFLGLANLVPVDVMTAGWLQMHGVAIAADTRDISGSCTALIRPERVKVSADGEGDLHATVAQLVFAGPVTHAELDIAGQPLHAVIPNDGGVGLRPGDAVGVRLPPESIRVLSV